jgi:hypothetical protein
MAMLEQLIHQFLVASFAGVTGVTGVRFCSFSGAFICHEGVLSGRLSSLAGDGHDRIAHAEARTGGVALSSPRGRRYSPGPGDSCPNSNRSAFHALVNALEVEIRGR